MKSELRLLLNFVQKIVCKGQLFLFVAFWFVCSLQGLYISVLLHKNDSFSFFNFSHVQQIFFFFSVIQCKSFERNHTELAYLKQSTLTQSNSWLVVCWVNDESHLFVLTINFETSKPHWITVFVSLLANRYCSLVSCNSPYTKLKQQFNIELLEGMGQNTYLIF